MSEIVRELIEYWPGALLLLAVLFEPLALIKKARSNWKTALTVSAVTCVIFLGLFALGAGLQSPDGYWPNGFYEDAMQITVTFIVSLALWLAFVVRRSVSHG